MADKLADKYTYRITWSAENEEYVGLCAEFPSLNWLPRCSFFIWMRPQIYRTVSILMGNIFPNHPLFAHQNHG